MPAVGGLAVANGIAKLAHDDSYTKIYQSTAELYNRMNKGKGTPFGSRGIELSTEQAGVYTFGFPEDGGDLPAGDSVETIRPLVFPKRYMHAVQLTGLSMEELAKNRNSETFVENWVSLNLDGAVEAAHVMHSILGWGTGNGRLATLSAASSSSTTVTVNNNDNTRYLRKNMRIDIVDPNNFVPKNSAALKITSDPDVGDTTFTVDTAVTASANDLVVIRGGANRAFTGLRKIIDDGTNSSVYFQNVNRTNVPKYKARLVNASSKGLSLTILRRLLGAEMFPAIGTLRRQDFEIRSYESQWSAMAALGWTLKRYEGKSKSMDLGYTTLEWEGIPWVTDVYAPKDEVFFINWKTIRKFVTKDWGWDETTGSIWNRVPSDTTGHNFTDKFEAYYDVICNYGCLDPRQNGMIYSLTVPTGY